ncbi:flagellar export protein FliJ [Heyndrickxia sporothermodurans]|uniref:flagellar export protein FliJ n=1 Tax=Heyndrickxia sporothermodurans TaxID=46224 RepID=UPI002E1C4FA3|nr:flagellar export protein FliJ [Heyndrickxia sporothermodurans]MED3649909.1 flagellar export protein FliJ [Heyndrickxia sporothermodurans]MED3653351.1 flagellar export protein FliJ [Heyndrickxia sporothermodurans]MED3697895.1 flagellar export protein FliJ [Heyndrickxia sporothermodurans]MED3781268.1 flagellar export protein FliJ [Heyndrickxia sporothermodurans]
MKYQYKFEKILSLKEREKDEALSTYQKSVKRFENVAEELYQLLKKKEDLLDFQTSKLETGLSIQEIRHHQRFITNLEKSIKHYQDLVINARNQMNWYEQKLQEKNIEVKKYEKLKEKHFEKYLFLLQEIENKQIDEISTQIYFHRIGN